MLTLEELERQARERSLLLRLQVQDLAGVRGLRVAVARPRAEQPPLLLVESRPVPPLLLALSRAASSASSVAVGRWPRA